MDWLTLSMGKPVADLLCQHSSLVEAGRSVPGFERSERRVMIGGEVWRRFEPRQPSRRWSMEYESWEWEGSAAQHPAGLLRGTDVAPSRVDVAWDFEVRPEVTACVIARRIREYVEASPLEPGVSGQGKIFTHYVGSPSSDRRLRIYRRDLLHPALLHQFGPILRIEVVLRDQRAKDWWRVWSEDQSAGLAAAAGHVWEMTGRVVQPECWSGPPPATVAEEIEAAQLLLQFVEQHGSTLEALRDAGIDVFKLTGSARRMWSRFTKCRQRQKVEQFRMIAEDVEQLVGELLVQRRAARLRG